MFPRALGESGTNAGRLRPRGPGARIATGVAAVALGLGLASCGGGQRQDVTEPSGSFKVQVAKAKFPNHQKLADTSDLQLEIQNAGNETVPNLTVTINTVAEGQRNLKSPATSTGSGQGSFNIRVDEPNLASPFRPVWVLEQDYPKLITSKYPLSDLERAPTAGAAAAQTDTFQFGPVKPNEGKDIAWRVTPVRPGTYTVHYEVSASLTGKAKAITPDGSPVKGEFVVTVSAKPTQSCVTGGGKVVHNCGPLPQKKGSQGKR
jgi:hypothetical protein